MTAPKQGFGQDAATGVKHGCGAGGCTYVVPRGSAGCNLAVCVKSCFRESLLRQTDKFSQRRNTG